ncbi:helix-turn-helix domain-containing protein [Geovibrio ferrireducens]|uniref:helix-turn-helix domain-containing protein n=1 Tax=Geovibrio ferrireducens TaxID=46201 RepID=UPI002247313C|nr:helix-turn-helix transcriptional regulator [Geovibrio ferrireducens]
MDLAERLKTLRRHFKISQSDIGDILSVRQQAVSHYEKSGNIDAAKLEVLADHFGLDIKFFYEKAPLEYYLNSNRQAVRQLSASGGPVVPAGWDSLLERISRLSYANIKNIEKVIVPLVEVFEGSKE